MAYFKDLSEYAYFRRDLTGAKNIGWLEKGYEFKTAGTSEETLDLLWEHCGVAVKQTRGFHQCDLCAAPHPHWVHASRHGINLTLGSSEIRVFSHDGRVYAAPNLIYHYVHIHHYKPPDEFLSGLKESLPPTSETYFEKLREAGIEWEKNHAPATDSRGFRFEKIEGKVRRVEVKLNVFRDES
jgi:hypothetical protein